MIDVLPRSKALPIGSQQEVSEINQKGLLIANANRDAFQFIYAKLRTIVVVFALVGPINWTQIISMPK